MSTFQPRNFTGCSSKGVNSVVLAMADGLFGLHRSERADELPGISHPQSLAEHRGAPNRA